MTDDRHGQAPMDELGELLSTADGPLRFPEPARSELLDQMIRTAVIPRSEDAGAVLPFVTEQQADSRPRRAWIIGVAAALVVVVVAAIAVVTPRNDAALTPADQSLLSPMTVDQVCELLPPLVSSNGLGDRSVQLSDVSLAELDDVARLLAWLSSDAGGPVEAELVDDAITRVRLMAISVDAADTDAAMAAMAATRTSIRAVLDEGC